MTTRRDVTAILALRSQRPRPPDGVVWLLLAVATLTPDRDGWRHGSTKLVAAVADLAYNTMVSSRETAIATGWLEYEAGNGRGVHSRWRLTGKVPSQVGYLSGGERYPIAGKKGTQPGVQKVPNANALTSANANTAVRSSADKSSADARTHAREAAAIRGVYPGVTDDETEEIIETVTAKHHPGNLPGYLASMAANGDLRLPCNPDGDGQYSRACRAGDSAECLWSWCECRCHTKPVTNGKDLAGE